jgi:hypothetical protein
MMHIEAGDKQVAEPPHLAHPDWYKRLTETQLAAYIRYQFVYLSEHVLDWDDPAHTRKRSHWDGGTDLYGVRRSNIWAQVAREVMRQGAVPGIWVHAQFSPAADLKLIPGRMVLPEITPQHLLSKDAAGIYVKYHQQLPDILKHEYQMAGETLARRLKVLQALPLSPEERQLYALCDESYVTAPPFFRHAFATLSDCPSAVEQYLPVALLQYEANQQLYDATVAEIKDSEWLISPDLKKAVIEFRQHWEAYHG